MGKRTRDFRRRGRPQRTRPASFQQRAASLRRMVQVHTVSGGSLQGWVHTHGMDKLGLAELEARHVPRYLMRPAATLLWAVADYMRSGHRPVRVGQHMLVDGYGVLTFRRAEPMAGYEDHYAVERWIITDEQEECACCAGSHPGAR